MTEDDSTSMLAREAFSSELDGFRNRLTNAAFTNRNGVAIAEETKTSLTVSRDTKKSGSAVRISTPASGQVPKTITKIDIFQLADTSLKYSMSVINFFAAI